MGLQGHAPIRDSMKEEGRHRYQQDTNQQYTKSRPTALGHPSETRVPDRRADMSEVDYADPPGPEEDSTSTADYRSAAALSR